MNTVIRIFTLILALGLGPARAADPSDVLSNWYRLSLELVRHTPTQSPPVAARSLAYLGVTAWEVAVASDGNLHSLAGQLNGLSDLPHAKEPIDPALALQAALAPVVAELFAHTGPTGQRALAAMTKQMDSEAEEGLSPERIATSRAYGASLAQAILEWAKKDGGDPVENMGFPMAWTVVDQPGHWKPTSKVVQQQAPLLPNWGKNRPFAMPAGSDCGLPPPTAYSEDPASDFYKEAKEVADTGKALTPEQTAIARFWSDDAMLTTTPPGHWTEIALQIFERDAVPFDRRAEVLARLGIGMADAFIGCWDTKFRYDLVRPITYIKAVIDPKFEPLLNTPPFPEYPSGHSVQSGAAAVVLTAIFGENFAFSDASHENDGQPAREFPSFAAAADEAAISRLYGGIHFRPAIEDGLAMGRCIGAYAAKLVMR